MPIEIAKWLPGCPVATDTGVYGTLSTGIILKPNSNTYGKLYITLIFKNSIFLNK